MAKMWAGRFTKETDQGVNDFNSSIAFDARMYRHDIVGSIAHATMLAHQDIISQADADAIIEGLGSIRADIDSGALQFDPQAEDIHMFIEAELPGYPEDVVTFSPGMVPCSICVREVAVLFWMLSDCMVDTAPVRLTFFWVPYPTTTVASSMVASSFI